MKFLIDENIDRRVAEFLIQQGHDVMLSSSGAKNGEIIKSACKDKRILITSDVHFSNILMYPPHKYSGIIRIKIHPPSAKKEIIAVKNLLTKYDSFSDFSGKLFVVEESDFRMRK